MTTESKTPRRRKTDLPEPVKMNYTDEDIYALARGNKWLQPELRDPTKQEIYLAQMIERLHAELREARLDLIPPIPKSVVIEKLKERAESAEAKVTELVARVAVLVKELEFAQAALYNGFEPDNQSAAWHRIDQRLSNLHPEAWKVMELVEAADAWEISDENVDPMTLEHNLIKAVRNLRGGGE